MGDRDESGWKYVLPLGSVAYATDLSRSHRPLILKPAKLPHNSRRMSAAISVARSFLSSPYFCIFS